MQKQPRPPRSKDEAPDVDDLIFQDEPDTGESER